MTENENLQVIENESLKAKIMEQLETVIDPELGIDIVNLGLVYTIELYENGHCKVQVTLTTMGCPFADVIQQEIKDALNQIEEIKTTEVKLIWYPAWNPDRMSRYAKIALGMS